MLKLLLKRKGVLPAPTGASRVFHRKLFHKHSGNVNRFRRKHNVHQCCSGVSSRASFTVCALLMGGCGGLPTCLRVPLATTLCRTECILDCRIIHLLSYELATLNHISIFISCVRVCVHITPSVCVCSCIDSWFEINRSCPEHPSD